MTQQLTPEEKEFEAYIGQIVPPGFQVTRTITGEIKLIGQGEFAGKHWTVSEYLDYMQTQPATPGLPTYPTYEDLPPAPMSEYEQWYTGFQEQQAGVSQQQWQAELDFAMQQAEQEMAAYHQQQQMEMYQWGQEMGLDRWQLQEQMEALQWQQEFERQQWMAEIARDPLDWISQWNLSRGYAATGAPQAGIGAPDWLSPAPTLGRQPAMGGQPSWAGQAGGWGGGGQAGGWGGQQGGWGGGGWTPPEEAAKLQRPTPAELAREYLAVAHDPLAANLWSEQATLRTGLFGAQIEGYLREGLQEIVAELPPEMALSLGLTPSGDIFRLATGGYGTYEDWMKANQGISSTPAPTPTMPTSGSYWPYEQSPDQLYRELTTPSWY